MTTKGSDKKQWTDPKDFGLPWVEIKPIQTQPKTNKELVKQESVQIPAVIAQVEEEKAPLEVASQSNEAPKTISSPSQPSSTTSVSTKKKGTPAWAWLVFVLFAAVFAVLVWQVLEQTKSTDSQEAIPSQPISEAKVQIPQVEIQEEITSNEDQENIENQVDKESDSLVSTNNSVPDQSGTTIAQSITGNLIRIESQAERPQYFIIVGSVPSEADALKLIPGFQTKVSEVYLISPYSESRNYRVAIGKFPSFRSAAEELDRIKSQYSEELWILKY